MSEEQGENTRMNVAKDESPEVENKELNETEKDVAIMQSDDKHLLENKWTFWYYEPKGKISAENLHKVTSFDTVEDFWCLFNHIKKPSQLSLQSHYSYFKYGIKPNWDDDKNSAGGRWILEIPLSNKIHLIDEYWMKILLSMIGEVYDSSEINGAIISIQSKITKLSVWTNNASKDNKNNILAIGSKIKEVLDTRDIKMVYESFKRTENKQNSFIKRMYSL